MLSKSEKSFTVLYILILIAELICGNIESLNALHYFTKPALLITLLIFFSLQSNHLTTTTRVLVSITLGFSLLGDTLLLFVNQSTHFFTSGLLAFLLVHVFYILVFLKKRNTSKNPFVFIALMLVYGIGMFSLLKNGLGKLMVPVIIYMLAILTMSTSAFLRKEKVKSSSYNFVFIGAILFMISDSILALNKFYEPLPASHISIMLTYAIAQLSIVFGILKQR